MTNEDGTTPTPPEAVVEEQPEIPVIESFFIRLANGMKKKNIVVVVNGQPIKLGHSNVATFKVDEETHLVNIELLDKSAVRGMFKTDKGGKI